MSRVSTNTNSTNKPSIRKIFSSTESNQNLLGQSLDFYKNDLEKGRDEFTKKFFDLTFTGLQTGAQAKAANQNVNDNNAENKTALAPNAREATKRIKESSNQWILRSAKGSDVYELETEKRETGKDDVQLGDLLKSSKIQLSDAEIRRQDLNSLEERHDFGEGEGPNGVFDSNGFGEGMNNAFEVFGAGEGGFGIGGGEGKGGYDAYGNWVADAVAAKIHENDKSVVTNDKAWAKINTSMGFLFKETDQVNKALQYTFDKLDKAGHSDLKEDAWSVAFLTANQVSVQGMEDGVADYLKSDLDFMNEMRKNVGSNGQTSFGGEQLEKFTHDANYNRLMELSKEEGFDGKQIEQRLQDELGFADYGEWAFATNGRALLESVKNLDYLDNIDKMVAQSKEDQGLGDDAKARFNVSFSFLPYANADEGAFPSVNRDLEFAQQSKLKDSGVSFDPTKTNHLHFSINSEADMNRILDKLNEKFADNKDIEIGKAELSFHRHGGEDGGNLTGTKEAGEKGASQGHTVTDESSFHGDQDGDTFARLGKLVSENNGSDVVVNGDTCHSGIFMDKIKDDVAAGIQDGLKASGRGDDAVKVSYRDNDKDAGWTPAQTLDSVQGYMSYKYDSHGAAGLELVMSNTSSGHSRQDVHYVSSKGKANEVKGTLSDSGGLKGDQSAKDAYYDMAKRHMEESKQFLANEDSIKEESRARLDAKREDIAPKLDLNVSNEKEVLPNADKPLATDPIQDQVANSVAESEYASTEDLNNDFSSNEWAAVGSDNVPGEIAENSADENLANDNSSKEEDKKEAFIV